MPEKDHHNPFEEHIESDAFDVSKLERIPSLERIDAELQDFLDSLPEPLNQELYDHALDDRQRLLCAHLVTSTRILDLIRENSGDDVADLTDEQLTAVMTIPVILSLLIEERLHHPEPPEPEYLPELDVEEEHPLMEIGELRVATIEWRAVLGQIVTNIRNTIRRLRRPY